MASNKCDSLVFSWPNSQARGTGFDSRQRDSVTLHVQGSRRGCYPLVSVGTSFGWRLKVFVASE